MSWHQLERTKVVRATLQKAIEFRDMDPCPHDRGLKPQIVAHLLDSLAAGETRPFDVATAFCAETGKTYRVNGKHSANAVARFIEDFSGKENKPAVIGDFLVTHYHCDTLRDLAELYSTFDRKGQARSPDDVYLAYAASEEELAGVKKRVISRAVQGICLALSGPDLCFAQTPESRAAKMVSEKPFVMFLSKFFAEVASEKKAKRLVDRAPVVAAMFLTFKTCREDAGKFWELVATESAPNNKCASRLLGVYLRDTAVKLGAGAGSDRKIGSRREMLVKCIHAWNAWRQNRSTDLKYYAEKPIPKAA